MGEIKNAIELVRAWSIWAIAAGMAVGIPATLEPPVGAYAFPAALLFLFWIAYKLGKAIDGVAALATKQDEPEEQPHG